MMNDYQRFIHASRYARWLDNLGRRETWEETVDRYICWMYEHIPGKSVHDPEHRDPVWRELYDAIVNLEIMPSMRCLMTAGPALDRTHVAGYNCAYTVVDSLRAFDEAMYILMCGTGVGYSVERKYIEKLPKVAHATNTKPAEPIYVAD